MKPRKQFLGTLGFFSLMLWISRTDSDFSVSNAIAAAINRAIPWLGLGCGVVIVATYVWLLADGMGWLQAPKRAFTRLRQRLIRAWTQRFAPQADPGSTLATK